MGKQEIQYTWYETSRALVLAIIIFFGAVLLAYSGHMPEWLRGKAKTELAQSGYSKETARGHRYDEKRRKEIRREIRRQIGRRALF